MKNKSNYVPFLKAFIINNYTVPKRGAHVIIMKSPPPSICHNMFNIGDL